MATATAMDSESNNSVGWRPWLYAALGVLLVIAAEQTLEAFEKRSLRAHERTHFTGELAQIRARLEGAINGNLLAINGLTAVIAAQPDIDQQGFARIARGLVAQQRSLRNIAGAPGMVITLIYPVEGSEAAIGLDYRTHPTQSRAALRAIESGHAVVAGPLQLVQGGSGLIVRAPVFLPRVGGDGDRQVWGLVAAVIDTRMLYRQAGLPADGRQREATLAIRGRDGTGAQGAAFYGDPQVFSQDPVTVDVSLPDGSWQIAAVPTAGWGNHSHGDNLLLMRISGFVLAALLGAMAFLLARGYQDLSRTSRRLSASQALFQGFMDNLPAGAFIRDPGRGDVLLQNRWLRETLSGHLEDCGTGAEQHLAALGAGPQLLHHQLRDGTDATRYCDTLRFLLPNPGGTPLVGGVVMDVTDRTIAEHALADNQARLRSLFNTIPDLVWLQDPDGVYLACNPRFEALLGASEADIVGRRDHDLVDGVLAETLGASYLAAISSDEPVTREASVIFASDGHRELLEITSTQVDDAQARRIGILGIARDVTARRQAEDELRASTHRLEAAESIAHIGHWEYLVADGSILWSDETYRIFGLSPHVRVIDYSWVRARVHPDDQARHDAFLQRMLESSPGDRFPEFRYRMLRPDGEQRQLSVRVEIQYAAAQAARLFGTVQDITESQRLHNDLEARLAELTRWQGIMLGREDRVQELKREINRLLAAQGQPVRYPSQADRR